MTKPELIGKLKEHYKKPHVGLQEKTGFSREGVRLWLNEEDRSSPRLEEAAEEMILQAEAAKKAMGEIGPVPAQL